MLQVDNCQEINYYMLLKGLWEKGYFVNYLRERLLCEIRFVDSLRKRLLCEIRHVNSLRKRLLCEIRFDCSSRKRLLCEIRYLLITSFSHKQ